MLKLLITHAAADVYTDSDGKRVKTVIADEAIDLLLDRAEWPYTWGLGVLGDPSNTQLQHDPFTRMEAVVGNWWGAQPLIKHEPRLLLGGVVDLAGVSFTLCLFDQSEARKQDSPDNSLYKVLQRPAGMTWVLDDVPKTVRFTWSDPWEHQPITFTMNR